MLPILPPATRAEYLKALPERDQFRVLRHELLGRLARSTVAGNYALRGSTVLKHWFGDLAREPNDLDLVSVYPHDPERCVAEILYVGNDRRLGGDLFPVARQNVLPMWEYDLFPGVRFHLPSGPDHRTPTVQLDVAFDNDPELPREEIELAGPNGLPPVRLTAWTREACLASKLCWIANDCEDGRAAEEDDLRDAILLAERGGIQPDVLQICVEDVLRVQKRDVSVFGRWDEPLKAAMRRAGRGSRGYPEPMTGRSAGEYERRPEDYDRLLRGAFEELVYDLAYHLAPLLSPLVWLPARDEWGFLLGIVGNPDELLTYHAYADWLLDRDDDRGEWLRLHVRRQTGETLTEAESLRVWQLSIRVPERWQEFVRMT